MNNQVEVLIPDDLGENQKIKFIAQTFINLAKPYLSYEEAESIVEDIEAGEFGIAIGLCVDALIKEDKGVPAEFLDYVKKIDFSCYLDQWPKPLQSKNAASGDSDGIASPIGLKQVCKESVEVR